MTKPCRLIAAIAIALAALAPPARAAELAIVGATVYVAPDAAPIERGTVLVRDGRITAVGPADDVVVPPGARRLDGTGGAVTAGFWNSHVHMLELPLREAASRPAAELTQALAATFTRWGFTTVFDVGTLPGNTRALRRRVETGEVTGPMILTADGPFFPKDGTPVYVRALFQQIGAPNQEVASVQEAQARARQQLADGADGVKLFAGAIVVRGVLPMDTAIARAIVDEAHRAGKPAFAHPTNLEGLEVSLASGVDVLTHTTPTTGPWPPALAARLAGAGMAMTPTLSLFETGLKQDNAPADVVTRFLETCQQQVAAFAKAGGQLLFGTDVGFIDVANTRREIELMAGAGLDWRQILASLTTAPAKRFGFGARKGRLEVGMDADLVVLRRDPAQDVTALADVQITVRGGRVIYEGTAQPGR